jgi:hypothetical protein
MFDWLLQRAHAIGDGEGYPGIQDTYSYPPQNTLPGGPGFTTLDGWVYLVMLAFPFIVAVTLTLAVITYWKKISVKTHNILPSVARQYWFAIVVGFMFGAWSTYAFQELLQFLIQAQPLTVKWVITMGILVALLNPMIYDYLRVRGKQKQDGWLYAIGKILTVRPCHPQRLDDAPPDYPEDDTTTPTDYTDTRP